jgi:hypothetical protein
VLFHFVLSDDHTSWNWPCLWGETPPFAFSSVLKEGALVVVRQNSCPSDSIKHRYACHGDHDGTTETLDVPWNGTTIKWDCRPAKPEAPKHSAGARLLRSILDPFAGILHVFAEAVGRVAADGNESQEGGGKEQKKETLRQWDVLCFHGVRIEPKRGLNAMG